ncbi:hypothetical protein M406DRAFT_73723 [Cryphonectria parasitica EP155]|uniref:DUF7702 domain-containing protein n=1 Tax=Cryphonectria parasitica (strain ATCC 38755 / EP155) TaxID=660469 RepID=A0A9P5CMN5_CRYP1|nr:uncharacterized protein M406DRAFT_73723 [Cryphonectria parasitica EP155]KAF3763070.1 hypothetical protein M406DRAFT_73723 [Cryphonectria parasitica EP155]
MTSSVVGYAAAVLTIYLVLLGPAIYCFARHGVKHQIWVGWLYFILFCLLRIIGSAMEISSPDSIAAAIISSVGLSPLTISLFGILHEARFYLLSLHDAPEARKIENIIVLFFHITVVTAVALIATGASGLSSAAARADPTKLAKDWKLAGAGGVILLLTVAAVAAGAIFTILTTSSGTTGSGRQQQQQQQQQARRLALAIAVAAPVLSVRLIGTVVYYFGKNTDMNPVTGLLGVKVGLYLVPEVITAVLVLAGGLASRSVKVRAAEGEPYKMGGRSRY